MSQDDILDEWRIPHSAPEADEEDLAAIQEVIDDMENGDTGIPFDEFDRDFRSRHNLPPHPSRPVATAHASANIAAATTQSR